MIKSLHQIEITSRCNLRCKYCPHPKMQRPKMDMDIGTFGVALKWAKKFAQAGTQPELNLAGIGESTLHPQFEEFVAMAADAVEGTACQLILATNGIEIVKRPELANILKTYNVQTWVSLHRPEMAGQAIEILRPTGILRGVSADPSVNAVDWAGQVKWHVSANTRNQPCTWLYEDRVIALSDGRISQCCFDAEGVGVMGTVFDDLDKMNVAAYSLCDNCHLEHDAFKQTTASFRMA